MLIWTNLMILVGMICLQIFLSARKSCIPGLILPGIMLLWSILAVINTLPPEGTEGIVMVLSTFIGANIPTLILLAIYFTCRGKYRRKKQMEKMNIQDLD